MVAIENLQTGRLIHESYAMTSRIKYKRWRICYMIEHSCTHGLMVGEIGGSKLIYITKWITKLFGASSPSGEWRKCITLLLECVISINYKGLLGAVIYPQEKNELHSCTIFSGQPHKRPSLFNAYVSDPSLFWSIEHDEESPSPRNLKILQIEFIVDDGMRIDAQVG